MSRAWVVRSLAGKPAWLLDEASASYWTERKHRAKRFGTRDAAERANGTEFPKGIVEEVPAKEAAAMALESALEDTASDRFNEAAELLTALSGPKGERLERYLEEISNCRSGIYRILDSLKGSRK